ncbi:MAG TPA: hypothetical protein VGR72_10285 [Candidatus Acidoferrales bacterium]|nr:hypothetical protein [Candidatus Acidoferrales bacterium]
MSGRFPQFSLRPFAALLKAFGIPPTDIANEFFRFLYPHDDSAGSRRRLDVASTSQHLHPPLERFSRESRLLLDLAVGDRPPPENEAYAPALARFAEDEPAVKPYSLSHTRVVPRLEKHAAQARVIVFPTHSGRPKALNFQHTPQYSTKIRRKPRLVATSRSTFAIGGR